MRAFLAWCQRPLHKTYSDPVTGDPLTAGEKFSWAMQSIIRRWAFIGAITLITIVVWSINVAVGLTWWNLGASYLALLIESTVGIAMFSQGRRDSVIIRRIDRNEETNRQLLAHLELVLTHLDEVGTQRDEADLKRESILQASQDNGQKLTTLLERQAKHLRAVEENLGVVLEDP